MSQEVGAIGVKPALHKQPTELNNMRQSATQTQELSGFYYSIMFVHTCVCARGSRLFELVQRVYVLSTHPTAQHQQYVAHCWYVSGAWVGLR